MSELTSEGVILSVGAFYNSHQTNEYLFICPHCSRINGLSRYASLHEFVGEMFKDELCGGWWVVSEVAAPSIESIGQLCNEFSKKYKRLYLNGEG